MFNNGWGKSGDSWHNVGSGWRKVGSGWGKVGSGWGNVSSKPVKSDDNTLAGVGKAALYILPIAAPIAAGYWFFKTQKALINQIIDTTITVVSGTAITSGILATGYAGLKLYQATQKQPLA